MSNNVAMDKVTGDTVNKVSSSQVTIEKDNNNEGLNSLKQGQQITGIVVSADEQVTLDFNGQKVTTSNSVLSNAKPGDVKTFEVVKASGCEIELRVLDGKVGNGRKTFKAAMMKDTDWENILRQKEQLAKQVGREAEYKDIKNKLDEITSKMTEKDYMQLEGEGFPVETFTLSGLYAALNRVKMNPTNVVENTSEKMTTYDKKAIATRLKEENLPVTQENLAKISEALELSGAVLNMDEKAMQNLISTDATPSVQNIYKAYYSGTKQNQENLPKLSDKAWNELENQVKDVIKAAGYEVNDENIAEARWLIENKLPLTAETFTYKKDLEEIRTNSDKEAIFNKIIDGMKKGINPKDVSLTLQDSTSLEQIIEGINSISDEAITQAVIEDKELIIKNLITIQEELSSGKEDTSTIKPAEESKKTSFSSNSDYVYKEIKAKRQLEEIRLKMTLEAAGQLEKKGISIETEQLSKVVDELRELEESYYKNLLKEADAQASELSLQTLKETTESIEKLKYIPCSVLGSTLSERSSETIAGLLSTGSTLQAEYEKAGMAYETLMTVPNREYGDSIKKAFANTDSLLSEMKLDNTEQNKRAIRILGYNQMEINNENINQVKIYDQQVTDLISNLNPAVTVRMIKDGINPMEMPISELNRTIDQMKEEQGITSEDKYSTFLNKLEKEDGITAEERKAYIGIYRLLYNVDKSDGAVLGAVVKAGREVTLRSLLSAVQTSKKGSMDAVIDDEFGTLQSISHNKDTISEQLRSFTGGNGQQTGQPYVEGQQTAGQTEAAVQEQTEYLNRLLKNIKDELSPEKLKEAGKAQTVAVKNQVTAAAPLLSSDEGIWETISKTPIEKLLGQLRTTEETESADSDAYAGKLREIRELCKNSEQSIRFLNDFNVPNTPANIMMANQVLSNGESAIKKLLKLKNENIDENSENGLMETNDLSDKLIDRHSMNEVYEQLDTDAKTVLLKACEGEKIDSRKLAEIKSMGQQMTFTRTLASKEFYQVPIETDRGITNMNLTILRGTETSGKVSVNVWSEQLGNVKAEFTLKDQVLKGFFSSDSKKGLEQLQKSMKEIENAAQEYNVTVKQIDFGIQRGDNDTYSYQNTNNGESDTSVTNDTEKILYRVAKAIVQTVRAAQNSEAYVDRAVS